MPTTSDAALNLLTSSLGLVGGEIALLLAASGLFLAAAFRQDDDLAARTSLFALFVAAVFWFRGPGDAVAPAAFFRVDGFTDFIRVLSLAAGTMLTLLSWGKQDRRFAFEYYGCLLTIVAGVGLTAAANDLLGLFLSLELISIPTYLFLYLPRQDGPGREAVTKYFYLSIFSSALLLFGFSYLYGVTGSTNLEVLRAAIKSAAGALPPLLTVALVMVVAGLGFRITAAPFHFYAPDVYQGGPTLPVTMLAVIPKIAGFAALFQLIPATMLLEATESLVTPGLAAQAARLFWIIALVSMLIGNLIGLLQDNIKRLLAYSGIAHAGYMVVALGADATGSAAALPGITALFFYLVVYAAMTLGTFAIINHLSTAEREVATVDDLAGLGRSHPALAAAMAVFLFSLTGLPPTAGFWAKLNIFFAAWGTEQALYRYLALIMAVNAAVGAWYYLRVIGVMYLRDAVRPLPSVKHRAGLGVIGVCTALVLVGFVLPAPLLSWAHQATRPAAHAKPLPAVALK